MKFSLSLLRKILPEAKFVGFSCDEEFTFLNIAKPTGSLSEKINESNVLFFPVYAKNIADDGWYNNSFDRRDYLKEISQKNRNWSFVVDSSCQAIQGKQIVVDDIFKTIVKIYNYVLKTSNPTVIAVTGSVGKTTAVAMLEDAISSQHTCLRIYSKRITPLVLWSSVINFLDSKIRFVVLEMSFYRTHHIKWLVETLSPNVSVILNIAENHIGVNGVNINQIVEAKSQIITKQSIPVINADDVNLKNILKENKAAISFSVRDKKCHVFGKADEKIMEINVDNSVFRIIPFLATTLTLYQMLVVFAVCSILEINLNLVEKALGKFEPKENRISRTTIRGKKVVFDGDITHPSRLSQLANNAYGKSILIISEFNFGIDPIEPKIKGMLEVFGKFNIVKISNNASIPKLLKEAMAKNVLQNVLFVEPADIMDNLPSNSTIFYHHGAYFRKNDVAL